MVLPPLFQGITMVTTQFLERLFSTKPEDAFILIWEKNKQGKTSYWYPTTEKAIGHFNGKVPQADVYVGCGTSRVARAKHQRCKAADICGIPGVWLDIDILNPIAHKKTRLPETEAVAKTIIKTFPLSPTMVIHSGHGYQYWWVFDKFWQFQSKEEHDAAAELVRQFTWTVRDMARKMGYDLDMTFDLSRVMRVPGSKNFKDNPPKDVEMVEYNGGLIYNREEFASSLDFYMASIGTEIQEKREKKVEGVIFTLDPKAEPPTDKFDALYNLDLKFRASWEHERKDFKDDSPSAYDLSLASLAAYAGWPAQEIVNLLIAFRRKHGFDLKLREDYYQRTYAAAVTVARRKDALEEIAREIPVQPENPEERAETVKRALESLRGLFGSLEIKKIIKYKIDPPEYRILTDKKMIHVGPVANLIEQIQLRRKLAEATGFYMPGFETRRWANVAQTLLNACEEDMVSEEATNEGIVQAWLISYLQHMEPVYDKDDAQLTHRPFFMDNHLYLFGTEFNIYLRTFHKEVHNKKALGFLLKEYGFVNTHLNFKRERGFISRSVWKLDINKNEVIGGFADRELLDEANRRRIVNLQ